MLWDLVSYVDKPHGSHRLFRSSLPGPPVQPNLVFPPEKAPALRLLYMSPSVSVNASEGGNLTLLPVDCPNPECISILMTV